MDRTKILKVSGLIVALLIIGGSIGFAIGIHIGFKTGDFTSSTMEYALSYHQLQVAFSEADCQAVRNALKAYLTVVEKHKDNTHSAFSGTVAYTDLTMAHARLARVARKLGEHDIAHQHIQAAAETCRKSRWKDCSEDHILSVSKRFEQKFPIRCLSPEQH
ncbi:hypothetical protein D1AOALGA4SA_3321 [Olavius algarvensis Delta 1 endosymbiont]|nr:hypothetical protein D1AOALGA4SA_3321 [Olavius algarvensis Delta 1 endosymbiont]